MNILGLTPDTLALLNLVVFGVLTWLVLRPAVALHLGRQSSQRLRQVVSGDRRRPGVG